MIGPVKTVLLLVGILGPRTVVVVVTSTTVASLILGALTIVWFQKASSKVTSTGAAYGLSGKSATLALSYDAIQVGVFVAFISTLCLPFGPAM